MALLTKRLYITQLIPLKMENGRILVEYYLKGKDWTPAKKFFLIQALNEISRYTCIVFAPMMEVDIKKDEFHVVFSTELEGCSTHVGIVQKEMKVVSKGCSTKGMFMHEIMHILGFQHEHQRPDAAKYVKRLGNKSLDVFEDDWYLVNKNYSEMFEYDFLSIMHYTTALDDQLVKLNGDPIVHSFELSKIDKKKLDYFYNCKKIEEGYKNMPIYVPHTFCYGRLRADLNFWKEICVSKTQRNVTRCYPSHSPFFEGLYEYCETKTYKGQLFLGFSFEDIRPPFLSNIVGETHWHFNFGKTPSRYTVPDAFDEATFLINYFQNSSYVSNATNYFLHFNHYLHLGNSRQSYKTNPLNRSIKRLYDIAYNIPTTTAYICIAFHYKMWGNGDASLEVGVYRNETYFKPIGLFEYKQGDDESAEWKSAIIYHNLFNERKVRIAFAGYINKGGNIGIDNITVFECVQEPPTWDFKPKNILNDLETEDSYHYYSYYPTSNWFRNPKLSKCCRSLPSYIFLTYNDCLNFQTDIFDYCEFDIEQKLKQDELFKLCCE
ncbi:hypothetical protein B4U79_16846 [Dinothrombium tinctorium]|uniref:Metalloendopeptidase n=1 Tax=Dinothrombium tinctorium TaxID=1965070 RepID=A0A443QC33_9ACAR|nr:hypothetical protein B4U79_16846 [Dinothrombium tinctorium]